MLERYGRLPSDVVACVGGGSNAMGIFAGFVDDPQVRLWGVEAGGEGLESDETAASLDAGSVGVLHGSRSYLLQTAQGQVRETHSISAGLDYPGVGPEHAFLKDSGRATYVTVTDEEALEAFRGCAERRDRSGARERARDRLRAQARRAARDRRSHPGELERTRRQRHRPMLTAVFARARSEKRLAFIPYLMAGDPDLATTELLIEALSAAGADLIELGIPYGDPLADGPTIAAAGQRSLANGAVGGRARSREAVQRASAPIVLFTYFNPVDHFGSGASRPRAEAGAAGAIVPDVALEESESCATRWRSKGWRCRCSSRRRRRASARAASPRRRRFRLRRFAARRDRRGEGARLRALAAQSAMLRELTANRSRSASA